LAATGPTHAQIMGRRDVNIVAFCTDDNSATSETTHRHTQTEFWFYPGYHSKHSDNRV